MEERRLLRPLELGAFFDELFYLFRNNFLLFTSITAVVYIPPMILVSWIWGYVGWNIGQYILLLLQPFVIAAGTYAISKRYLGESCTLREAYSEVFKRFFRFIWTMLSVSLLTLAATLAFVFPSFLIYYWYVFVCQVFVLEGLDSKDARIRSKQIAEGYWWQIFVVYLIFGLIQGFATQLLALPMIGLTGMLMGHPGNHFGWGMMGLYTGFTTAVIMVLQLVISVLLYYDIRVRKEGFDLELLSKELQERQSGLPTVS